MAGKSNYLEDSVLNAVFRGVAFPTLGASVYVSLHTADPTDANTAATEVTGGSYARVAVARAAGSFSAPADNAGAEQITNSADITFPSPTADWGTVTHMGVYDAATAGNLLYAATLGTSRIIQNGDSAPSFAAGALTFSES